MCWRVLWLFVGCGIVACLDACSPHRPASGQTLAVCTEASPEGFDVVQYNSLITTNASADVLMKRLVEFDSQRGDMVPSLAQRWAVSPDGLAYTFYLRPNVAFQHNAL